MSARAVWLKIHDIRIRADHSHGAEQDVCTVARALANLYAVPSVIMNEAFAPFDDDWLDWAVHDPFNRAVGAITIR